MPALAALALVSTLIFAPGKSLGAVPGIKDPHGIACPAAPAGWFNPPGDASGSVGGGRTIIAPGAVMEQGGPQQGGNAVNVGCDYFTQAGKHLVVDLLYALPTDPNPINDFYFGCRSGGTKWTDGDRIFRQIATNQWASVAFYDALGQLGPGDVPGFVGVATQLLKNAEGFGHTCDLKVEPTPVLSRFQFIFDSSAGKAAGLFFIEGTNAKVQPIVALEVEAIKLNVRSQGKLHPLTILVRDGLNFTAGGGKTNRQVRLAVVVKSSKVPACPTGSTGTLTISTAPSVLLKVCSQSFLQGPAKASIIATS